MQRILEKQSKKNSQMARDKQYTKSWQRFWAVGEQLEKNWKTKKSWLTIVREERSV